MKRDKIIYWITTSLVAFMGLSAGIIYFIKPALAAEFQHLGFPNFFRIELGTAKIIGALALVLPIVSNRIKEWAYAGFAIAFISAMIAHIVVEGVSSAIPPIVSFVLLAVSYVYFVKRNAIKAVAA